MHLPEAEKNVYPDSLALKKRGQNSPASGKNVRRGAVLEDEKELQEK